MITQLLALTSRCFLLFVSICLVTGCASSIDLSEWDPRSENVSNLQMITSHDGVDDRPSHFRGDEILFSSDRDGNYDIWLTSIGEGGGTRQLTDYSDSDVLPSPHPDGEKFLFISQRAEGVQLFMGHLSRPTATAIADISSPGMGGYAPGQVNTDGNKIVYASGRHIWIYNQETRTRTQMVTGHHPSWYQKGEKVIFVRKAADFGNAVSTSIWTMNADGTELTQLISSGEDAAYLHPRVSPNGAKITYARAPIENTRTGSLGNWDIWVADIDGTNRVQLTTNPFPDQEPNWVGNDRIVFASERPESSNVEDADWNIWLLEF